MNLDAVLQLGALGVLAYTLHRVGVPLVERVEKMAVRMERLTLALVLHLGLPHEDARALLADDAAKDKPVPGDRL